MKRKILMKNRIFATLILFTLVPATAAMAQSSGDEVNPFYMEYLFSNLLVVVSALVMVFALFVILYLSNILLHMQKMEIMRQKGIDPATLTAESVSKRTVPGIHQYRRYHVRS